MWNIRYSGCHPSLNVLYSWLNTVFQNNSLPHAHISTGFPYGSFRKTSGERYPGVPAKPVTRQGKYSQKLYVLHKKQVIFMLSKNTEDLHKLSSNKYFILNFPFYGKLPKSNSSRNTYADLAHSLFATTSTCLQTRGQQKAIWLPIYPNTADSTVVSRVWWQCNSGRLPERFPDSWKNFTHDLSITVNCRKTISSKVQIHLLRFEVKKKKVSGAGKTWETQGDPLGDINWKTANAFYACPKLWTVSEFCFCLFVVFNPYPNLVYFKLVPNYTNYFCKHDSLGTSESIFCQLWRLFSNIKCYFWWHLWATD